MKKPKSKLTKWLLIVGVILVVMTIAFNKFQAGFSDDKRFDFLIVPKAIWARLSRMLGLAKIPVAPGDAVGRAGNGITRRLPGA